MAALAATTLGVGCAQIIGAADDRGLTPDAAQTPNFIDAGDAIAVVPEAGDPESCPPTHKRCNGACVPKSEPRYGCSEASCAPCSLPNADVTKCTDDALLCAAGTCKLGFTACGPLTAGCTTDLTAPTTCGGCNKPCAPADFCNPGGQCKASCDPGLTDCDRSCVDTESSPQHCGPTNSADACTTVCPTVPNGDAACAAGQCLIACRTGFAHCGGSGPQGPCTQQQVFYRDADGDGWGVLTDTKLACDALAAGAGYAAKAGDCNDADKNVNPGQTEYFPIAYKAVGGQPSYDYNCDGVESELPGVLHFTPCRSECTGAGLGPAGSGRAGPGVNDYCGSKQRLSCQKGGPVPVDPSSSHFSSVTPQADPIEVETQCGVVASEIGLNGCR